MSLNPIVLYESYVWGQHLIQLILIFYSKNKRLCWQAFCLEAVSHFSLPNIWELFYIIFSNIPESPLQGPAIQVSCEFLSSVIFSVQMGWSWELSRWLVPAGPGKTLVVRAGVPSRNTVTEGTKADVWSRLLVVLLQISMWESLQEKKFKHWIDILYLCFKIRDGRERGLIYHMN